MPSTANGTSASCCSHVTSDDLIEFGMIPEFVGRLPVLAPLDPLDEEAAGPHPHGAAQRFGPAIPEALRDGRGRAGIHRRSACTMIARRARDRDTGARGLRSIVEEVMTDIMFELPDMETKGKFTVTEAVVHGSESMFEKKTPDKKSA